MGGHFFCYTKAQDGSGQWWNFNDQNVTLLDDPEAELEKVFGGEPVKAPTTAPAAPSGVTGSDEEAGEGEKSPTGAAEPPRAPQAPPTGPTGTGGLTQEGRGPHRRRGPRLLLF